MRFDHIMTKKEHEINLVAVHYVAQFWSNDINLPTKGADYIPPPAHFPYTSSSVTSVKPRG